MEVPDDIPGPKRIKYFDFSDSIIFPVASALGQTITL